ncbi:MAG: hypothetical protein ACOYM8_01660 [Caulobacterales bacterium]|jgi:hypothetical protein
MTRASRSSDVVAEALERAAWAEADAFLARAWRETAVLERDLVKALAAVERSQEAGKRPNAAQKRMSACLDRAALALQDLEQVAALRRLRMGACGEAAYDPALHTVVDGFDVAPGDPVLVSTPFVVRGLGEDEMVLARADVAAARPVREARSRKRPR